MLRAVRPAWCSYRYATCEANSATCHVLCGAHGAAIDIRKSSKMLLPCMITQRWRDLFGTLPLPTFNFPTHTSTFPTHTSDQEFSQTNIQNFRTHISDQEFSQTNIQNAMLLDLATANKKNTTSTADFANASIYVYEPSNLPTDTLSFDIFKHSNFQASSFYTIPNPPTANRHLYLF